MFGHSGKVLLDSGIVPYGLFMVPKVDEKLSHDSSAEDQVLQHKVQLMQYCSQHDYAVLQLQQLMQGCSDAPCLTAQQPGVQRMLLQAHSIHNAP